MDELWQRYRSFWIPVLIGLGIFLVGLIAVHVATPDPDAKRMEVDAARRELDKKVEPSTAQVSNISDNAETLGERVSDWAGRIDQAGLEDPLATAVTSALRAAILRGLDPEALRGAIADPSTPEAQDLLVAFEGDSTAAGRALSRFDLIRQDRLTLLRTGDPNVGWLRLLNDVWSDLKVRANRADVDLRADTLGFEGVTSVTRAALPQRLLNLALIAELVDLAIRSGARSVDEIRFDVRADEEGGERFLRQWPVTLAFRGDMASLRPLLARLTDPARPWPLTSLILTQPTRGSPLEGIVQLTVTATSTLVRPEASLELEKEEQ